MKNKVSVIISSFNHEKYIKDSILSVLNQTYKNIELIVVDDGSTDNSKSIILDILKERDFLYIEQKNCGVAKALNKGIRSASGEYISFLASDDIFYPQKIEILMENFANFDNDTAMIFGDAFFIDEENNIIRREKSESFIEFHLTEKEKNSLFNERYISYVLLIKKNFIPAMSVLCKVDLIYKIGLFSEERVMEDYSMWLKIIKFYKIGFVDIVVSGYRQHKNNSIRKNRKKIILDQILILNEEFYYALKRADILQYISRYIKLLFAYLLIK